jgi:hypothetical protein
MSTVNPACHPAAGLNGEPDNLSNYQLLCIDSRNVYQMKIDKFVKSRHSGENRSPDGLQLPEKTGFLLSRE